MIYVGKGATQKTFVAHEPFLTNRSEFFRNALSTAPVDSKTREVKLPEERPGIFSLYLHRVYTGRLGTIRTELDNHPSTSLQLYMQALAEEYKDIFDFYMLSVRLGDVTARGGAMLALINKIRFHSKQKSMYPGVAYLPMVYEGTQIGRPCRLILIDSLCCLPPDLLEKGLKNSVDAIPKEALVDLVVAFSKNPVDPIAVNPSRYAEAICINVKEEPTTK